MNQLLQLLGACRESLIEGVIALAIGFILFSLLERIFLFTPARKPWRATLLDVQYAFLSMLYPPFINFVLAAIFGLLTVELQAGATNPHPSALSFAGQLFAILIARDCLIYVRHRIFHLRPVWAYHSVHHSSEDVNWISALRFHPAENIIESAGEIVLFLGCQIVGVNPAVLSVASLLVAFYNLFIHANLPWAFGPLRYVFVSPVFHRWHHSDAPEAADKNFAAMFSFIDLAFGTFRMPMDSMPETTGLSSQEKAAHPRNLAGQLLYPFRKH